MNANGTARATTSVTTPTAASSARVAKDISFTAAPTAQVYRTVFIGVNVAGLLGSKTPNISRRRAQPFFRSLLFKPLIYTNHLVSQKIVAPKLETQTTVYHCTPINAASVRQSMQSRIDHSGGGHTNVIRGPFSYTRTQDFLSRSALFFYQKV